MEAEGSVKAARRPFRSLLTPVHSDSAGYKPYKKHNLMIHNATVSSKPRQHLRYTAELARPNLDS